MAYSTSLPQRSGTFLGRLPFQSRGRVSTNDSLIQSDTTSYPGLHVWNNPQNALVDIVFVHGIPGHPRRSFSSSDEDDSFWPLWLLDESEKLRQCMRICTFGYSSEKRDGTVLVSHIEDHGKTLCTNLSYKLKSQNPIIFVAHSLGGLVVKAAINQADRETFADLSTRFHTILFLATPHHRADDASMLEKIIRVNSEQAATADLDPNFMIIESVNRVFMRHEKDSFRIWSFYEAVPPEEGGHVVVDRHCATTDREDEYSIRLHADHLGVARFVDQSDRNYHEVKDVLIRSVNEIAEESSSPERVQEQIQAIAEYFGVADIEQQDELDEMLYTQAPGTCRWLTSGPDFTSWSSPEASESNQSTKKPANHAIVSSKQNNSRRPRIFWLSGLPGSGKSHLSAAVIRHLKDEKQANCSFYFLKHIDGSKHDIGSLLKTLALQMARRDPKLRKWLFAMLEGHRLEKDSTNYMLIWKQIFEKHIFLHKSLPQFWVLDAVDQGRGGMDLIDLVKRIPSQLQYYVFLTSRFDDNIERQLSVSYVHHERITDDQSKMDIRLYLQSRKDDFFAVSHEDVPELIERILERSKGSFLWTSLVVQQLSTIYAEQKIDEVLDGVPDEMNGFYSDILRNMSMSTSVDLAQAILRWTACSVRPLTLEQLQHAILLDIDQSVPRIAEAVQKTCGHLVAIDQGKVLLAHETIRDFLLGAAIREEDDVAVFALDKASAHARLAEVCLMALSSGPTSSTRRETRLRNRTGQRSRPRTSSTPEALYEYASLFFSEHIVKSTEPGSPAPLKELEDFLKVHVRGWIEHAAAKADLARLISTGKNLKSFVDTRVLFQAVPEQLHVIRSWAEDLIYLVTHFGQFLLDAPSAIQTTIPPLCPSHSIIARSFGHPPQGLEVIGRSTQDWPDRISSTMFGSDYCTALACGEQYYAVGTKLGWIVLFDAITCQELWRIQNGADTKFMEFVKNGDGLVISSKTALACYNSSNGDQHWETQLKVQHRAITSLEDEEVSEVWAFTMKSDVVTFDLDTGEQTSHSTLRQRSHPHRVFMCGGDMGRIALSYRNRALELRELENLESTEYADVSTTTESLAFNSTKRTLIMSTFDGELRVLQMWNWQVQCKIKLAIAHLACSNDGELVLAGTNNGTIYILKSDTLDPIYQIQGEGQEIVSLMFSADDRRFIDIRRQLFNVWEPSALVRRKDGEKSSHEESHGRTSYSTAPSGLMQTFLRNIKSRVTSMVAHGSEPYVFCGKENGHVTVHETNNHGRAKHKLYEHDGSAVAFLDWNARRRVLVSCDRSSRILIHEIRFIRERTASSSSETWLTGRPLLDKRLAFAVRQILFTTEGDLVVVSTERKDYLWTLRGEEVFSHACPRSQITGTISQKWAIPPGQHRRLIEVEMTSTHLVSWQDEELVTVNNLDVDVVEDEELEINAPCVRIMRTGGGIWAAQDFNPQTRPILWKLPVTRHADSQARIVLAHLESVASQIRHLVGEFQGRLVFIDVRGWVSSISVEAGGSAETIWRYFPIPHYWQRPDQPPLMIATYNGDIIMAAEDEVTIVKRGLLVRALISTARQFDSR